VAERQTTGIAGLDAQLGGGIPPGSVHVLLGEPMNAQELLTYHFAAGGAKIAGSATYVTTSGSEEQVRAGIQMVGGDPAKVQVVVLGGRPQVPQPGPTRYVLDSFSEWSLQVGFDKAYARLLEMRAAIRSNGGTLMVTATPDLHPAREQAMLKVWADGILELGFDRQGFGLYPYLKVTKMRGVPDSARFLLFKETDRGLFMESTRRVF
jgi:KaiC/GvpD/RAD55 family RecA-like ATPase